MRILVTGATGMLGRPLVPALRTAGHAVVPAGRRHGHRLDLTGDVTLPAGLDVVVHLASATGRGGDSAAVDVEGTRKLVAAAAAAGVRHLLFVSIVGVDRVPLKYFRHKLAAERIVAAGGVPYTIFRATQFHEFVEGMLRDLRLLGLIFADRKVPAQPVDVHDVVERLLARVDAGPLDGIEEFAGPETLDLITAARVWAPRAVVVPIRIPGRVGRALRAGGLTTTASPTGERSFAQYVRGSRG
jgi:uncharacterized protein YbjT (DUF2867 family)